jgi:Cu-Zn family superoxide dismutase
MRANLLLALAGITFAGAALADYRVDMNQVDIRGVGAPLGTVTITAGASGGVIFTPNLKGLPPGTHGFHVHEFANCAAREKEGKMEPADLAGGHYDPKKTGKHAGPQGGGHVGDLPPLVVDASGTATQPISVHTLTLKDLRRRSLVIHEGGDNFSDQPKPNGGGGTRIACGVIGEK